MECYNITHSFPATDYGDTFLAETKVYGVSILIKRIKLKASLEAKNGKKYEGNGTTGSRFKHPNIATLKKHFKQDQHLCCVFEYTGPGDLYHRLTQTGALNFRLTQKYFGQIVQALNCLHKVGVAHRHIALENILLLENDVCQLCEFGLAMVRAQGMTDEGDMIKAPEVLAQKSYEPMVADIWSLGMILYSMLSGFNLVDRASEEDERFKTLRDAGGVDALAATDNANIPSLIMGLLNGMLQVDPAKRWSIQKVIEHRFLTIGTTRSESVEGSSVSKSANRRGRPGSAQDLSAVAPMRRRGSVEGNVTISKRKSTWRRSRPGSAQDLSAVIVPTRPVEGRRSRPGSAEDLSTGKPRRSLESKPWRTNRPGSSQNLSGVLPTVQTSQAAPNYQNSSTGGHFSLPKLCQNLKKNFAPSAEIIASAREAIKRRSVAESTDYVTE